MTAALIGGSGLFDVIHVIYFTCGFYRNPERSEFFRQVETEIRGLSFLDSTLPQVVTPYKLSLIKTRHCIQIHLFPFAPPHCDHEYHHPIILYLVNQPIPSATQFDLVGDPAEFGEKRTLRKL